MRVSAAKFFSARSGGVVVADDAIITDCYRLAKYYCCSPEVFLSMPMGDVRLHLERTTELADMMRREREAEHG